MRTIISVLTLICYLSSACVGAKDQNQTSDSNDTKSVVSGNTDFAITLYDKLKGDPNSKTPRTNLFFSPYSISTALSMVYGGARGETQKQMAEVLHFTLPEPNLYCAFGALQKQLVQKDRSRGYRLFLANALWLQKGEPFLKEFLDLAQSYFEAGLNQVDFVNETEQSRRKINNWVEEQTNNKIINLIPPGGVNTNTTMVLTNAIYFKGQWQKKFSWWKTKKADFSVSAEQKVKVPLMHLKEDFKYYEDENLQALELPYKGDEISMLVLLPKEIEGLPQIENSLTAESLDILLSKMVTREVDLYFPKFKIVWGTLALNNVLSALGMPDAFDPGKADFSGINDTGGLWISDLFHKAFIEVNEKGTEAAAATAVVMAKAVILYIEFRADHPFIFIIKDNRSGTILFMGRLSNPAE
jgi:serpin B